MNQARPHTAPNADGIAAPLRDPIFRRIWLGGLVANFGNMIQGVGVAWTMAQMAKSADLVALVQASLIGPAVLVGIPAGAIGDVYDRRLVVLFSLSLGLAAAIALAILSAFGALTPGLLLALCFVVGCGAAIMDPVLQAAVSEQVTAKALPSAIALNSMSRSLARTVGPAIGGVVVAVAGTFAAFALNTLLFLPLILALVFWRRHGERSSLPRERLGRAVIVGIRYVAHSPPVRTVVFRSFLVGLLGSPVLALLPLVVRDLLHEGARTYGLLLGSVGVGAVIGAANIAKIRRAMSSEAAIRFCALCIGTGLAVIALSRHPAFTALGLVATGCGLILSWTVLNVSVQFTAAPWVASRALAAYQAVAAAGIALGSWGWGLLADRGGLEPALLAAATLMLLSPLVAFWIPLPTAKERAQEPMALDHPKVVFPVDGNDGPLVVEIEYRVRPENARAFHDLMQEVELVRHRTGAYAWSIAQDIADPESWIERYHCPTWHDYLLQRNRSTVAERALESEAIAYHAGPGELRVRRMLERPLP